MEIKAKKVTAEGFKKYGQVVELQPGAEAAVSEKDFEYWKQQAVFRTEGSCEIGVLKVKKHDMAFGQMEQHTETPEVLIGVDGGFVVPVGSVSEDVPAVGDIEAFEVGQGQAIVMDKSCWHWVPNPVDKDEVTVLVLFRNNTSANDLVIKDLSEQCEVVE